MFLGDYADKAVYLGLSQIYLQRGRQLDTGLHFFGEMQNLKLLSYTNQNLLKTKERKK